MLSFNGIFNSGITVVVAGSSDNNVSTTGNSVSDVKVDSSKVVTKLPCGFNLTLEVEERNLPNCHELARPHRRII